LRGCRRPEPAGAVSAQVQLAVPVGAVHRRPRHRSRSSSLSRRLSELAHPAHPNGDRVGVVAKFLCHPAGAVTDAELPQSPAIALANLSPVGMSVGCSAKANSASHRASSAWSRVTAGCAVVNI
jgi:hypothetical protein